jgi:LemA protein
MTDEMPKDNENTVEDRVMKAVGAGIVLFCIVLAVIFVVSPLIGAYNSLVDSDLQVQRAAANVKVDLERRADLLPNLASTVKGSAVFEHNTLVEVIAARAGESEKIKEHLSSSGNDIDKLDMSNAQLTTLLGNFVKLQEQYPTLQSTQQFREFGAQVTATENEILADRQTYNAAVMQYKSVVTSFPTNLVADKYGFKADKYHMWEPKDVEHMETVPDITFDFENL